MIPGKDIELGGGKYVVPPLTLGALQRFQARLSSYSGTLNAEDVQTVIEVATAALQRNYPDMTTDQVADLIDLGNIQEVFMAVMSVSGLAPQGEAKAAPAKR